MSVLVINNNRAAWTGLSFFCAILSMRKAICAGFSSPHTYISGCSLLPCNNNSTTIWVSNVDLPIPGSPPMSITAPGTIPFDAPSPPKTRSISSIWVEKRDFEPFIASTSGKAMSVFSKLTTVDCFLEASCAISSTNVFHSPQLPHWPTHLGVFQPQDWHTNTDLLLAMLPLYSIFPTNNVSPLYCPVTVTDCPTYSLSSTT